MTVLFGVAREGQDDDHVAHDSSGMRGYDVEYKLGAGSWTAWLTNTTQTEAEFSGAVTQGYTFRARAADRVGNVSAWVESSSVTVQTVTKYYIFGGRRIAERQGSSIYYLHGDHLSSVSLVTDSSGQVVSQSRYLPFGEIRWTGGAKTTDISYTGQRADGFDLYDYRARFYSVYLNRWAQPDLIIPDQYNPADWDRYSYVRNNPIRYNDPSGHMLTECGKDGSECRGYEDAENSLQAILGALKSNSLSWDQLPEKYNDILVDAGYTPGKYNQEFSKSIKGESITNLIFTLPGSSGNWSNKATGLDTLAWLTDIYATGAVTYAGFAGAALPSPLIAAGLPEVPFATGLAGMAIAELYVQPMLLAGNVLATLSSGATIVADTKSGNTRIEEGKFSSTTTNSIILTDLGWLSHEAYLSLAIQSAALANDLQWISLP